MDTFLGFLILAGIVLIFWLFNKAGNAAARGINRTVQGKHVATAAELLPTNLVLHVPPGPSGRRVLDTIIRELNVFDSANVVTQRAYIDRANDHAARLTYGKKLFTAWAIAIIVTENEAGGTTVITQTIEATEADGVVPGMRELKRSHERITAAVNKLSTPTPEGAGS